MRLFCSTIIVFLTQSILIPAVLGKSGADISIKSPLAIEILGRSPAAHPNGPALHLRRQDSLSTSTNSTSNGTLTEAEKLVKAAQAEALIKNTYLIEHPRKNLHEFHYGVSTTDDASGTGVNETVAKA